MRKTAFKPKNMMSLEKLKNKTELSEHEEQVDIVQWLWERRILYCSIPNGAKLPRKQVYSKRQGKNIWISNEAMKLLREGMQPGAPDLLIFNKPNAILRCNDIDGKPVKILHVGVALEMKKEKGGVQSPEQKVWQKLLEELGWIYILAHGSEEAKKKLIKLGF